MHEWVNGARFKSDDFRPVAVLRTREKNGAEVCHWEQTRAMGRAREEIWTGSAHILVWCGSL